ncbi:MAG TPA: GntR family transcriptional regulator [Acidobacteriaceae bacterium]
MTEIPLYGKVEEVLASEIAHGEFEPGDRLPSEEELSLRFVVSKITIRRAIQNLIQRGVVEIRRGLGTFVLAPKKSLSLTWTFGRHSATAKSIRSIVAAGSDELCVQAWSFVTSLTCGLYPPRSKTWPMRRICPEKHLITLPFRITLVFAQSSSRSSRARQATML